jgi:hypothetical protein
MEDLGSMLVSLHLFFEQTEVAEDADLACSTCRNPGAVKVYPVRPPAEMEIGKIRPRWASPPRTPPVWREIARNKLHVS